MIAAYYLFICLIHLILALPLFLLSLCKAKFKRSIKARFFLYDNFYQSPADVHFHACSLGEVKTIISLNKDFDSRLSVITQTGFDEAKKHFLKLNFLAFESLLPFWFKPCKVLVIFEAELWLMLVYIAKLRGAKILLINARISDHSLKKYQKLGFLYRKIFSYIDEVYAQSKEHKQRLESLGAKNVFIAGNLKSSLCTKLSKHYSKPNARLIIFASTHEGEEELLLRHFNLQKGEKLIIAPRHPERFLSVYQELKALRKDLSISLFSSMQDKDLQSHFQSDIMVLDRIGELVNLYAICDLVILGGSFIKGVGGHNPVEIAQFEKPIISGIYIYHQEALYQNVGGIIFCEDLNELNTLAHSPLLPSKIKQKVDLKPILQSIQGGINARKSL